MPEAPVWILTFARPRNSRIFCACAPPSRIFARAPTPRGPVQAQPSLAAPRTCARSSLTPSKAAPQQKAKRCALGLWPSSQLKEKAPSSGLYGGAELAQVLYGRLPGQTVPLPRFPGIRGTAATKRAPPHPAPSPLPPTSLGQPGSPSCPCPAIHSQAILQVSRDFASVLFQSNSQTICHDPARPVLLSGGPYINL